MNDFNESMRADAARYQLAIVISCQPASGYAPIYRNPIDRVGTSLESFVTRKRHERFTADLLEMTLHSYDRGH